MAKEPGARSQDPGLAELRIWGSGVGCFRKKLALWTVFVRGWDQFSWLYSRWLFWVTARRWGLGGARRGQRMPRGYLRGLRVEVEGAGDTGGRLHAPSRCLRTSICSIDNRIRRSVPLESTLAMTVPPIRLLPDPVLRQRAKRGPEIDLT